MNIFRVLSPIMVKLDKREPTRTLTVGTTFDADSLGCPFSADTLAKYVESGVVERVEPSEAPRIDDKGDEGKGDDDKGSSQSSPDAVDNFLAAVADQPGDEAARALREIAEERVATERAQAAENASATERGVAPATVDASTAHGRAAIDKSKRKGKGK